jgi:hypothetical protein
MNGTIETNVNNHKVILTWEGKKRKQITQRGKYLEEIIILCLVGCDIFKVHHTHQTKCVIIRDNKLISIKICCSTTP